MTYCPPRTPKKKKWRPTTSLSARSKEMSGPPLAAVREVRASHSLTSNSLQVQSHLDLGPHPFPTFSSNGWTKWNPTELRSQDATVRKKKKKKKGAFLTSRSRVRRRVGGRGIGCVRDGGARNAIGVDHVCAVVGKPSGGKR